MPAKRKPRKKLLPIATVIVRPIAERLSRVEKIVLEFQDAYLKSDALHIKRMGAMQAQLDALVASIKYRS